MRSASWYGKLLSDYFTSLYRGFMLRKVLEQVETYCMFIGYPRSGHSLVGSLLSAHPDVVIAHELDALRYVQAKFGRNQIYSLILRNDREFTLRGRTWTGYQYSVPNQWQGSYRKLRVIGDKQGPRSAERLRQDPALIQKLQKKIFTRMRLIHFVRNPYDNIATESKHYNGSLPEVIEYYFSLCRTVKAVCESIEPSGIMEISLESFIQDPRKYLRQLCGFLGVECTEDYLNDCAGIVFKEPRKTRRNAEWTDDLIQAVRSEMANFDFLNQYVNEPF